MLTKVFPNNGVPTFNSESQNLAPRMVFSSSLLPTQQTPLLAFSFPPLLPEAPPIT